MAELVEKLGFSLAFFNSKCVLQFAVKEQKMIEEKANFLGGNLRKNI